MATYQIYMPIHKTYPSALTIAIFTQGPEVADFTKHLHKPEEAKIKLASSLFYLLPFFLLEHKKLNQGLFWGYYNAKLLSSDMRILSAGSQRLTTILQK